jgi:protein AaeX
MMGEAELFGVYFNAELITSLLALVVTYLIHRLLVRIGVHRHIWHLALFETALFFIVWGGVILVIQHLQPGTML